MDQDQVAAFTNNLSVKAGDDPFVNHNVAGRIASNREGLYPFFQRIDLLIAMDIATDDQRGNVPHDDRAEKRHIVWRIVGRVQLRRCGQWGSELR